MRISSVSVLGLLSVAACSAGGIQIGGSTGLTSNYITQGTGAVCAAGAGNCVAGSTGNFRELNYDLRLFDQALNGSTAPVPFAGYTQTTATAPGSQLGQFAMISDGTSDGASNNFWDGVSATTMTVPIGILGVSDVWAMLSNFAGVHDAFQTVVTFNFGTSANGGINNVLVVHLQNSSTAGSPASGQTGSAVDCATSPCGVNNLANGALAPSSLATATLNGNPTTGVTVNTTNLFTTGNSYTSVKGTYSSSTSGTLSLYAQDFQLAAFAGEYLVSMGITELSGVSGLSQTALSAITVNQVPEPSTVFLFLTGIGVLGFARFRRK